MEFNISYVESAIYYKAELEHLGMCNTSYTHYIQYLSMRKLKNCIRSRALIMISKTKYATSYFFFHLVVVIYHNFKEECDSNNDSFKRMVIRMIVKFEKCWTKFNEILDIEIVPDPHNKLNFIERAYWRLYGHDAQVHNEKILYEVVWYLWWILSIFTSISSSSLTNMLYLKINLGLKDNFFIVWIIFYIFLLDCQCIILQL